MIMQIMPSPILTATILLVLSAEYVSTAKGRIRIRQFYPKPRFAPPLPSHVFSLPPTCATHFCQQRAVAEVRAAGCLNVLLFDTLFMLKATCLGSTIPDQLNRSRRFVDIALDHRVYLAALARRSSREMTASRDEPRAGATASSLDAFERRTTLGFGKVTLPDGRMERIAYGVVNGSREDFRFNKQREAAQCSPSRGEGVSVYVIDTGCRTTHAELRGRAISVVAPGSRFIDGEDDHGHGTHVAATIAGSNFGFASLARVVCIKALSERNEGSSIDVIAGIELAARMHRAAMLAGGRGGVVSISLGVQAPKVYRMLDRAVEGAGRVGLAVVVAAGNSGADACTFTPARAREAITVGAVGTHGRLARFSNWGKCVTVAAPGVHVWSAGGSRDEEYGRSSGTSMAAPFVSGLVALMIGDEKGIERGGLAKRLRTMGEDEQLPVVSVDGFCRYVRRRNKMQRWVRNRKGADRRKSRRFGKRHGMDAPRSQIDFRAQRHAIQ